MTDATHISEPARLAYAAGIHPLDHAAAEIALLLDATARTAAWCAANGYAQIVDTSPAAAARRILGLLIAAGWQVPGGVEIPDDASEVTG